MDALLHAGLSNAALAALLAVVAAAASAGGRRPALAHALWLLVLLKLLTPPLLEVPLPWPASPGAEGAAASAPEPAEVLADAPSRLPEEKPAPEVRREPDEVMVSEEADPPAEAEVSPAPVPESIPPAPSSPQTPGSPAWTWSHLVGGLWLAGSLGWFLLAAWRICCFRRLLVHARKAPGELQEQARELAERLGLGHCPEVELVPGRVSPMLWALGRRPRLLVPAGLLERLGPEGLRTLLAHELAHLRRRDHWVRVLEFLALGLYWWHPVAWYARRQLREAEEQCCDAWVVATLPGAGRAYAEALVETLDFLAAPAVPPLASGVGRTGDLKRRLTMIMRGTTPRTVTRVGCLVVFGLAGLLPLGPTWAEQPSTPPPAPPRPEAVNVFRTVQVEKTDRNAQQADLDKAQADLKQLQVDLEKKTAEVRAAEAKLKLAQLRAARDRMMAEKTRQAESGKGQTIIHIEIIGKTDEIKDMLKKLDQAVPGAARRVIIMRAAEPDGLNTYYRRVAPPPPPPPPAPGAAVQAYPLPPLPAPSVGLNAPAQSDPRIERVEKKLEAVLRELEALRREMKRRPGAAPFTAPAYPGGVSSEPFPMAPGGQSPVPPSPTPAATPAPVAPGAAPQALPGRTPSTSLPPTPRTS